MLENLSRLQVGGGGGGENLVNFRQNGCSFCCGIEKEIRQIIQDFKSINIKKRAKKLKR